MNYLVWKFYFNFTHPLSYVSNKIKSTTEGVGISCGSVQWANLPKIHTPPTEILSDDFHTRYFQQGCIHVEGNSLFFCGCHFEGTIVLHILASDIKHPIALKLPCTSVTHQRGNLRGDFKTKLAVDQRFREVVIV